MVLIHFFLLLLGVFTDTVASAPCDSNCPMSTHKCSVNMCISRDWPLAKARYAGRIEVDNSLEPLASESLGEIENVVKGGPDPRWLHLHRGSSGIESSTLSITWLDCNQNTVAGSLDATLSAYQLRYVAGEFSVPLTGNWLDFPFIDNVNVNQANFDSNFPLDGIFHISFEMRDKNQPGLGLEAAPKDVKPFPCFVHLKRPGFQTTTKTPAGIGDATESGCANCCPRTIPHVTYVDSSSRAAIGYPADPEVSPIGMAFADARNSEQLFVESMGPRSPLFQGIPMWWADPFHPLDGGGDQQFLPFIREFPPKLEESHNFHWFRGSDGKWTPQTLRVSERHERMPVRDGPRGIGWMSAYVGGTVDSQGRFAFAETSGRVGLMMPDGEIVTLAGYVTKNDRDPVWFKKPTDIVRINQEMRGTWLDVQTPGFGLPLDVAVDPLDENRLFVVAFEDNCVYELYINELSCLNVTVSVLAGSPSHVAGEADGLGHSASFDGPTSIAFDAVCDCLYVADQTRGRIRKITREGAVTTLFGQRNVKGRKVEFPWAPPAIWQACGDNFYKQECTTPAARVRVDSDPDIFIPHTIRTDSLGRLLVLDHGFGLIRQIDVNTGKAIVRARVHMKNQQYSRGWAWFDVDRTGALNNGVKDGIFWTKAVGEVYGTRHGTDGTGDPACSFMGGSLKEPSCDMESSCLSSCRAYPEYTCADGCSTNMFSEMYGYAPPDSVDEKSYLVFVNDRGLMWTGWPKHVNPPHYPWLVAVDPRGALLISGIGQHGVSRVRKIRPGDVIPRDESFGGDKYLPYWEGHTIYEMNNGAKYGVSPNIPAVSPLALGGYVGQNMLQLGKSTWGTHQLTDEELLDAFHLSPEVRNDAQLRKHVLFYLRSGQETAAPSRPAFPYNPEIPVCQGQTRSPTQSPTAQSPTVQSPTVQSPTPQTPTVQSPTTSAQSPTTANNGGSPPTNVDQQQQQQQTTGNYGNDELNNNEQLNQQPGSSFVDSDLFLPVVVGGGAAFVALLCVFVGLAIYGSKKKQQRAIEMQFFQQNSQHQSQQQAEIPVPRHRSRQHSRGGSRVGSRRQSALVYKPNYGY